MDSWKVKGTYTERGVYRLFRKYVDKQEYPSYQGWKQDMLKMGILLKYLISFSTYLFITS